MEQFQVNPVTGVRFNQPGQHVSAVLHLGTRYAASFAGGNTTPPTFPTTKTKGQPDGADEKVFMGMFFKDGNAYILKSGNDKHRLDSQKKAKSYEGKDVQITGKVDEDKKLIHVEKIKVSPAM